MQVYEIFGTAFYILGFRAKESGALYMLFDLLLSRRGHAFCIWELIEKAFSHNVYTLICTLC